MAYPMRLAKAALVGYLVAIAVVIDIAQGSGFRGIAQMDSVFRGSGFLLRRLRSRWL